MISRKQFEQIRARWGAYSSWAVWADASGKPKSNVGDLRIFDPDSNSSLLQTLRSDVVMVGLNISRTFKDEPFRNFHDRSPRANDFKIRFAFTNTHYYGAYMTDFIKRYATVDSRTALEYLRASPSTLRENADILRAELDDLESRPTILAFGSDTHALLAQNLPSAAYSRLIKLTHYSCRVSKEAYRRTVLGQAGLS